VAEEALLADAAVVRVLVDEALAVLGNEDAAHEAPRRRQRNGHLAGVHADHVGARAHRHADGAAVVALDTEPIAAPPEERAVTPHHLAVLDEAPGREDDAAPRAHELLASALADDDAHDRAVVDDQRLAARIVEQAGPALLRRRDQALHQEATRSTAVLRLVRARHRRRDAV